MKRITIKDIAKALDMHHSTVSRSLRNDKSVNSETRKKVLAYAHEHGYQINRSALHLRGDKSNVIGVVVPNVNHSFFSNIISTVANMAFEQGYVVSVFQSNESLQQEKEIVKALIQNNVAGVLASVSMETRNAEHFKQLTNLHIPLVMFDRVTNDIDVTHILSKNAEILERTVDLFVQKGYRRIAHLSGISDMNVFFDRQVGYRNGVRKNTLDYEKCSIVDDGFSIENGQKVVAELLSESEVPDALICDSHFLLLGAITELRNRNIDIESNFGLAGFGGYLETGIVHPGVISLLQPEQEMATAAFECLMDEINGRSENKKKNVEFDAEIIDTYKNLK